MSARKVSLSKVLTAIPGVEGLLSAQTDIEWTELNKEARAGF